jgi:hypothetical protein
MREIHNNVEFRPSSNPAAGITGNATVAEATINRDGYEALEFSIQSGVITDGSFTYALFAGDAANMSDEAQVSGSELLGANPSFTATTDNNKVKKVGYAGSKQYARLKRTQAGATTGGFINSQAILGRPKNTPTP